MIDCDVIVWLGLLPQPVKILKKKYRQNKWLNFSLSWGNGEEGREEGWSRAHGHQWTTSYQTKASNSIGLTDKWSKSAFKVFKEIVIFYAFLSS